MGYKKYKIEYDSKIVRKPQGKMSNKQYASTKEAIMKKMKNKLKSYPYAEAYLFKLKKNRKGYKVAGKFGRKRSGGKVLKKVIIIGIK